MYIFQSQCIFFNLAAFTHTTNLPTDQHHATIKMFALPEIKSDTNATDRLSPRSQKDEPPREYNSDSGSELGTHVPHSQSRDSHCASDSEWTASPTGTTAGAIDCAHTQTLQNKSPVSVSPNTHTERSPAPSSPYSSVSPCVAESGSCSDPDEWLQEDAYGAELRRFQEPRLILSASGTIIGFQYVSTPTIRIPCVWNQHDDHWERHCASTLTSVIPHVAISSVSAHRQ